MRIWLNGRFVGEDAAAITATDPAALYGLGLFEVTRAYGGVPFRLRDHLVRMRRSAKHFALEFRANDEQIYRAIRELCRRNALPEAYVRIEMTAGGRVFVLTRPLERPVSNAVAIAEWRRDPRAPLHGHKTLNYLENVLTREMGRRFGYADTLFLDLQERILEGCVSNVFLVERGDVVTPPLGQHILPGVTRKVVLEIAGRLGVKVVERPVRVGELRAADEAFITNAILEVHPVTRVASRRIGRGRPGPVTRLLAMAYRSVVLTETR